MLANDTSQKVAAPQWAASLVILYSSADVVHVAAASGHVRLSTRELDDKILVNAQDDFCASAQGDCTCPNSPGSQLKRISADGGTLIALTGGPTGAGVTVTGMSLDEYCKRTKPAAKGPFKGNVCALVGSSALQAADIDAAGVQLPTRTGSFGTAWTCNWGTQIVVGGADHFLGVGIQKLSPQYFASAWAAFEQLAQIRTSGHLIRLATFPYNSVKTGEDKKGYQGAMNILTKSGYEVTIALFDRPATESQVKLAMFAIAADVGPAVSW